MSASPIDPERLAALLDGRLSATERDRTLRELSAAGDETLAAFADAAAAVGPDAGARSASASAVTADRTHRSRGWWVAAGSIGIAAVAGWLLVRPGREPALTGADGSPLRYAAALDVRQVGVPDAADIWTATRGSGDVLSAPARSARIGARLTDLAVALAAHDSVAVRYATELAELSGGYPGGGALAAQFRDAALRITASREGNPVDLEPLARAVVAFATPGTLHAAAWAEAVRAAAARGDSAFLSAPAARPPTVGPAIDSLAPWRALVQAVGAQGTAPPSHRDNRALVSAASQLVLSLTR